MNMALQDTLAVAFKEVLDAERSQIVTDVMDADYFQEKLDEAVDDSVTAHIKTLDISDEVDSCLKERNFSEEVEDAIRDDPDICVKAVMDSDELSDRLSDFQSEDEVNDLIESKLKEFMLTPEFHTAVVGVIRAEVYRVLMIVPNWVRGLWRDVVYGPN
jgi:hypothetical protein